MYAAREQIQNLLKKKGKAKGKLSLETSKVAESVISW
jgi:hypothetical protein